MTRLSPRFTGVLVTISVLAVVGLLMRGCPSPDSAASTASGKPRRGGQLVASARGVPRSFNRLMAGDQPSDMFAMLTQGSLVRVNRSTFELEPWLAEKWESSADGLTHTLHLRQGVTWSDGTPFTSADVLFTLQAMYDSNVKSVVASSVMPGGKPMKATAPDASTVVLTFAQASGAGISLLDTFPILPKHKLESAYKAGTFPQAWNTATPPAEIVSTGPFVLREFKPGERLVFDRNPTYWRTGGDGQKLPYLDRLVLQFIPEQNAELLALQAGTTDLTQSELRPDDYVPVRRAEEEGKLTLIEGGVGPDADALWFCMNPEIKKGDRRQTFVQKREFRQALSHAVDREEFAQTVFLGEAVPVWGPITPGNKPWFSPNVPRYPHDVSRARELLKSIGLEDRNGNGVVETTDGIEARFTVMTQRGNSSYERGVTVLREQAATIGVAFDAAPLEYPTMIERLLACQYEAVYMRPYFSNLDPANNMDFWLSSGSTHFWHMSQKTPATDWETRIDTVMREQAATLDPERRRDLFNDAQRILAENVPVLYFVAPRLYFAHSKRTMGVVPSVMRPPILWNADSLSVAGP
ncbi:MAG TPA: ABC transporter substrate-binding protein [Vicinamibacterales bacterium]|jgi:peptide/nickel transport system substrate-binding protein|nr:ABC transporter substrate-binding protein [Vicinamibacterales bacterium]